MKDSLPQNGGIMLDGKFSEDYREFTVNLNEYITYGYKFAAIDRDIDHVFTRK